MTGPQGTFTGVTASDGPDTDEFNSLAASFQSEMSKSYYDATATENPKTPATTTGASATGASASVSVPSSTTFSTSTTPAATTSLSQNPSITGSSSASNGTGAVTLSKQDSCNSLSCSSALKAAVAVPIVVAAIVGIFLFFFFARRRRRNAGTGAGVSEKKPKKAHKKWSRHLRVFSFDAELLMGGRFSSSNSMRSRDASLRSAGSNSRQGAASIEPSLHSIEEVAPPYRDAVSHVQPPSPTHTRSGAPVVAAAGTDPILRAASTATAPPPYQAINPGNRSEPPAPVSRNPFADSAPVSPIEGSPFNDPPGERPTISRGSSLYQSINTEDVPSEAGSIREAQVGRRISVRNSGTPPSSGS